VITLSGFHIIAFCWFSAAARWGTLGSHAPLTLSSEIENSRKRGKTEKRDKLQK